MQRHAGRPLRPDGQPAGAGAARAPASAAARQRARGGGAASAAGTARPARQRHLRRQLPAGLRRPAARAGTQDARSEPRRQPLLAELAQSVHSTERTLLRRCQRDLGMSLAEWRQRLRVVRAMPRLEAGDTVENIAHDLGYSTASSFIAMFRRLMGVTPDDYRRGQAHRSRPEPWGIGTSGPGGAAVSAGAGGGGAAVGARRTGVTPPRESFSSRVRWRRSPANFRSGRP
ncbi:helix-turn-helix domain-containing protein [Marinobacterium aestuariivivens]|uniref:Helix-turn-helix domain-containing protein n=1 Tax=Marinobacterium aestuariivivens TaxID=1698799 RepID=A0ABW2A256_9GAMM